MFNLKLLYQTNRWFISKDRIRKITQDTMKRDSKTPPVKETPAVTQTSSTQNDRNLGPMMLKPTDFQKTILVWVKKFPSKDKVPDRIPVQVLLAAQSKARIKTCNYMIGLTIIGFLVASLLGKREAEHQDFTDMTIANIQKIKDQR